jgi:lipopolysaccharide assembly outer membrane protein LptD (OstA)
VGPPALRLSADYVYSEEDEVTLDEFDVREQLDLRLSSRVSQYWSVAVRGRWDLQEDRSLSSGLSVGYHDECFLFEVSLNRQNYDRSGIDDDTTLLFTVGLKNLGEFGSGAN